MYHRVGPTPFCFLNHFSGQLCYTNLILMDVRIVFFVIFSHICPLWCFGPCIPDGSELYIYMKIGSLHWLNVIITHLKRSQLIAIDLNVLTLSNCVRVVFRWPVICHSWWSHTVSRTAWGELRQRACTNELDLVFEPALIWSKDNGSNRYRRRHRLIGRRFW